MLKAIKAVAMVKAVRTKKRVRKLRYVVRGAVVECGSGSQPTRFMPPYRGITIGNGWPGTEYDTLPEHFEGTFGMCKITGKPCTMSSFLPKWYYPSERVKYRVDPYEIDLSLPDNEIIKETPAAEALLIMKSVLVCTKGDKVTFVTDGQEFGSGDGENPFTGPMLAMILALLRGGMPLPVILAALKSFFGERFEGMRGLLERALAANATGNVNMNPQTGRPPIVRDPRNPNMDPWRAEQLAREDAEAEEEAARLERYPAVVVREPYARPQNRTRWCYAAAALIVARRVGFSEPMQRRLNEYREHMTVSDIETREGRLVFQSDGIHANFIGRFSPAGADPNDGSTWRFFCHHEQEFAVAVHYYGTNPPPIADIRRLARNNVYGNVTRTLNRLTGRSVTEMRIVVQTDSNGVDNVWFRMPGQTIEVPDGTPAGIDVPARWRPLKEMLRPTETVVLAAVPTGPREEGHAYVLQSVDEEEGRVESLTMYDPWSNDSLTVSINDVLNGFTCLAFGETVTVTHAIGLR